MSGVTAGRDAPLLEVTALAIEIPRPRPLAPLSIVRDLTFQIDAGEVVGLVGESGSGKTMTARALSRLLPAAARQTAGAIRFRGRDLAALSEPDLQKLRGSGIGLLLQEAMSSLHPTRTVRAQLVESLRAHGTIAVPEAEKRAVELLGRLALPDPERCLAAFAHQLSGGQKQRVALALALAPEPDLLVVDEPTSALDTTIQAQVLDLLAGLRRELGLAILLISHDLAVVAERCDRALVLYAGELVETNALPELVLAPRHPYTAALWKTIPLLGRPLRRELGASIPGQLPGPAALPAGCLFHPRCSERTEECTERRPPWTTPAPGGGFRCLHPLRSAGGPA